MDAQNKLLLDRLRKDRELVVDVQLANEVAAIPNVTEIELWHGVFQSAAAFLPIMTIRSLERLELGWFEVAGSPSLTNDVLLNLQRLTNLRELRLDRAYQVDDYGAKHIAAVRSLRELTLEDTKVTDGGVEHLSQLPQLELLSLEFSFRIKGPGLMALSALRSLKWLSLQYCSDLEDAAVDAIAGMPQLETILLNGCPKLSWESVRKLARLPRLRDIALALPFGRESESGMPEFGEFVKDCPSLRDIRNFPDAVTPTEQEQIVGLLETRR